MERGDRLRRVRSKIPESLSSELTDQVNSELTTGITLMKETEAGKIYCFVDESGDPVFFNKKGKDLVKSGESSPVFIAGYFETKDNTAITRQLRYLREEISNDEYLRNIPSIAKSLKHFHAKDDCPEVREKVFKAIKEMDIEAYIIVSRKDTAQFIKKFGGKDKNLYSYLVEKLFENRLHLHTEMDIYFSKMGNTLRESNMRMALEKAMNAFKEKWGKENDTNIRIFIQEPSEIMPLQVIDYLLWTVYRLYTKKEMRYYNFISDKIRLVVDIFDSNKYPANFYTKKNPLDIKKISPLNS